MNLFLYTSALEQGRYPESCPFNTHRPGMVHRKIASLGMITGADRRVQDFVPLERDDLERYHTPAYLDTLLHAGQGHLDYQAFDMGLGTADCPVFHDMYDYIRLTTGGAPAGARHILRGEATRVFSPSGGFHHAAASRAGGFCYVNDVVIAAMILAEAGKRVLFLDVDVHHCDGVQAAFESRADVMTISLHESGATLFPGTGFVDEIGTGPGRGYTANIPLPVGTDDLAYKHAFDTGAWPLINAFKPDVIIIEAGLDGLSGDPLAHLHLTNNVYADIVEQVMTLDIPMLVTGGGGYHVANTVRGWTLIWSTLCGDRHSEHDLSAGMGGAMLENSDWIGGLRDRVLLVDGGRRDYVDSEVSATLNALKRTIFSLHGLAL